VGMLGIFSEFEREMIVARVNAGLARARQDADRRPIPGQVRIRNTSAGDVRVV
jgi:DNA invertase Pin-like site-specific DNA recombinase